MLVQETQSAKDTDMTCCKMLLIKATTCLQVGPMSWVWPVDLFAKSDFSRSSLLLKFPAANNNSVLFQRPRSRWRQDALQAPPQIIQRTTGWDGCGPFLSEGMRCITWNTRGLVGSVVFKQKTREFTLKYLNRLFDANNISCLQEVHGKDEYLQAILVLAPRFRFFDTFILGNENAGGSAICIHRGLLPEEAIVTNLITCQGRDRLVNIIDFPRLSLLIANLTRETFQEREAEITNLPWTQTEKHWFSQIQRWTTCLA